VLEFSGNGPAIEIRDAVDVGVRDLSLITERNSDLPSNAIEIDTAALVRLERLNVIEDPLALLQFLDQGGANKPIGGAVALARLVLRSSVRDCNLAGGGGVVARSWLSKDDKEYLVGVDLEVGRNLVLASDYGVVLGVPGRTQPETVLLADGTAIRDNRIWGCVEAGVAVAAEVFGGNVEVMSNIVGTLGHGASLSTDRTAVAENTLIGLGRSRSGAGVTVVRGHSDLVDDVWLRANRIDSFADAGVRVDATVTNLVVDSNTIARCGQGIVMSDGSKGQTVRIVANHLSDIGTEGADSRIILGIGLVFTTGGEVLDNTIARVATADPNAVWRAGIQLIACPSATVSGNTVSEIAPREGAASVGIGATLGFERLDVLDNNVSASRAEKPLTSWALLIGESMETWAGSLVELGNAIWWVEPNYAFNLGSRDGPTETAVRGNHLLGVSVQTPTAEVETSGSCTFAENWCTGLLETDVAVVRLGNEKFPIRALVLANNQVRHPPTDGVTVESWVDQGAYEPMGLSAAVLGNVTQGFISLNGGAVPPPWHDLNVRIP
jgi:hypothetical protein